jgi:hypothetical protein
MSGVKKMIKIIENIIKEGVEKFKIKNSQFRYVCQKINDIF